jgi:hypothetical protein
MYNEKIEALISAALADGVLTEKEKQVLFKRAQAEGIDLDEFEMVLDARLVELEKAEKEKAAAAAPKSTKYGDVRKCPVCGAMVPALAGACPECGYEFSGVSAVLSSQKLAEKLAKEEEKWEDNIAAVHGGTIDDNNRRWQLAKNKEQYMAQIVRSFTIPNSKADLFEFISMTRSILLSPTTNYYLAAGYMTKYKEALYKVKHLFPNDNLFIELLNGLNETEAQYKSIHRKQPKVGLKPGVKFALIYVAVLIGLIIVLSVGIHFADY